MISKLAAFLDSLHSGERLNLVADNEFGEQYVIRIVCWGTDDFAADIFIDSGVIEVFSVDTLTGNTNVILNYCLSGRPMSNFDWRIYKTRQELLDEIAELKGGA